MIIGLSGYARTGKDTLAEIMVEDFGFTRIAFADKLREVLEALNPIVFVESTLDKRYKDPVRLHSIRVKDVIEKHGWENYKESMYGEELRGLLQRLGTEAGRQILGDTIWVDAALADVKPDGRYVVTDVRFENEAEAIRTRGGLLWRLSRHGIGPATASDGTVHSSETSLDKYHGFTQYVTNNGTLEEFQAKVENLMDSIGVSKVENSDGN